MGAIMNDVRLRYRPRPSHSIALPRRWTPWRVHELRAALFLLTLASCLEAAPRPRDPCEPQRHIDTTSNVRICACVCDDDPQRVCPPSVPACWDDGSSSE